MTTNVALDDELVDKPFNHSRDKRYLLDALRLTPGLLSEFVKSIPEGKMDVRRGEGVWTLAEHISHLAQVQPMLLQRIERFLEEDRPEFVPYIPGEGEGEPIFPPRMELTAALREFADYRGMQLALLETADDTIWQRTAGHPEYERYSLHILARHVLMHDYWHMYRMEELWLTRDAYLTKLE